MAIGFTPKFEEEFSLNKLSREQFLALTSEVLKNLNWRIDYISNNGFIAHVGKGMFENHYEVKITVQDDSALLKSSSTGREMMDMGRNKKNIQQFIDDLTQLRTKLTEEEIREKYEELKVNFVADEEDVLTLPPQTKAEQFKDFLSLFRPRQGYFFTPLLININVLIFILMAISGVSIMDPTSEDLLAWGANFRPATLSGQWWRLFTCCFLHIGIIHLLLNMYALLYIGNLLEPLLGESKFLSAYIITGIAASVCSLWWHDLVVSAGASGAIFGMYGVFLALLTTNLIDKNTRKELLSSIGIFVVYNLVYGMKGGIDNAAHIGGLLSGIVVGYAFVPGLKNPENNKLKYATITLLITLLFVPSYFVYTKTSNDFPVYDEKIKVFVEMETKALSVYELVNSDAPKPQILTAIENKGIHNWQQMIKTLDEIDQLNLPVDFRVRTSKLRKYCELRIETYKLLYKTINEETSQYDGEMENYRMQIDSVVNTLSDQ